MRIMPRPARLASRAAAVVLTMAAVAGGTVTATAAPAGVSGQHQVQAKAHTIPNFVQYNGVNVRTGPGVQYPRVDIVYRGQGFNVYFCSNGHDNRKWCLGDLWGGRTRVWIAQDYINTFRP
ncbi:SH3 domain-containing protein [Amycolatopsis magusensis]|uniref:SH3 domain-containing protein n=1 Tax=Amycolatopsis magusensis TaxID=882444 RepID=UPI00379F3B1E